MKFTQRHTPERGFTLIELVVVIVILGILAAFAIPRFANIARDARLSALNGMAGSLRSTAALVHGMALARNVVNDNTGQIQLEGQPIEIVNGYPASTAAGIEAAILNLNSGTYAVVSDGTVTTITITGANADCNVEYREPTANGLPATIIVDPAAGSATGC